MLEGSRSFNEVQEGSRGFKKVQEGSKRDKEGSSCFKKVQEGSRRYYKVKKGQDGPRKFMNGHLFKNVKGEMILNGLRCIIVI